MRKEIFQKLLGKKGAAKQMEEDFVILDKPGLTVLFLIVGANPKNNIHVERLHYHWGKYLADAAIFYLTPKINDLIDEEKNKDIRL